METSGQANDLRTPTSSFVGLTPDRVLAAVEAGGLRPTGLCYPLNSFENRVYEVELEDRSRIIAKFYRPGRWSREQILEEHRFLGELDAEEIPVCTVQPFPDGGTLKQIDGIDYSLSPRRGGRAPDELGTAEARRLGRLVARLHDIGSRQRTTLRPPLDADSFVRRDLAWLAEQGQVPGHLEARFFATAHHIADQADRLSAGLATHRIHADLHLGNLLLRDDRLRLLDFDDMTHGPPVQDLWLLLPGRDDETLRLRQVFLEGYEEFRPFDRSSLRLIEPLRGMRMIHFVAWLARRIDDPAFRRAWPEFGSGDYWQRETADLEEQAEWIEETAGASAPPAWSTPGPGLLERTSDDVSLDNRDYFWDWEEDRSVPSGPGRQKQACDRESE